MSYSKCEAFLRKFYTDLEKLVPEEHRTTEVINDLHARVPVLLGQFEVVGLGDDKTFAMLTSAPDQESAIAIMSKLQLAAQTIQSSAQFSLSPDDLRTAVDSILGGTSAVEKAVQSKVDRTRA